MRVRYRALSDVTVLTESIVPPNKLASIRLVWGLLRPASFACGFAQGHYLL